MNKLIAKFKKDLNDLQKNLQKTIQKESDDLIKKVKTVATKQNIMAKTKELEVLVEKKLKKFEPALESFMKGVRANAEKAGIDMNKFESRLRSAAKAARSRIRKATTSKTKAKSRGKSRKASATTQS